MILAHNLHMTIVMEALKPFLLQIDPMMLPYKSDGPVHTPPAENYETPDGDYQDVSKKWDENV